MNALAYDRDNTPLSARHRRDAFPLRSDDQKLGLRRRRSVGRRSLMGTTVKVSAMGHIFHSGTKGPDISAHPNRRVAGRKSKRSSGENQ